MSIFVTGDCHGNVRKFSNAAFQEQKELSRSDTVIVCGDFGLVWEKEETPNEKHWLDWLENKSYTTVFVDGNHENHDRLNSYPVKEWNGGKVHEVRPHVLHLMRGEVYDIEGVKVLAFGGARSHDIRDGILDGNDPKWKKQAKYLDSIGKYMFRVKGVSWWENELPSKEEMENGIQNLKKYDFKVDYVVSHCAPTFVQAYMSCGAYEHDILTDYFQSLVYDYGLDFKYWFFGHYHDDRRVLDKFGLLYDQITEIPCGRKMIFEEEKEENW